MTKLNEPEKPSFSTKFRCAKAFSEGKVAKIGSIYPTKINLASKSKKDYFKLKNAKSKMAQKGLNAILAQKKGAEEICQD